MDYEVDTSKLKYKIYVRKSTDDPERQIRSIDDQLAECEQLAQRLHLKVIKPHIEEKKSAKRPHQRPKFNQMLKDIHSGVYDGIIAWNPDRLARNMLEGGMLIDMIDADVIKDLKFVTHHFTKDANGKMLLGMAFVLSKQYSDKLSQDVTRGVRRNLSEGKSPMVKHGYLRDENKLYRPDGKNFELIVKAWEMRRNGQSLESIEQYMNDQGYKRIVQVSQKEVDMDKRMLTDIFRDPFYYGILIQKEQPVDLRDLYDFEPAITQKVYEEVQQLSIKRKAPYNKKRNTFYPFKAIILCSFCQRNMYIAPSTSRSKQRFLYCRCDTIGCPRKKKSIRMKVILDFIYQFLEEGLKFTEKDYNDYYQSITEISEEKRQELLRERFSKQSLLNNANREVKDRALKIVSEENQTVKRINQERIEELEQEKEDLEGAIAKISEKLTDPEKDKLTIEQFLNLSKNAAAIVKSGDQIVKDKICRFIFLNLTVDEEKVLSYQSKEPFDTLLKQRQQPSSRGQRTRTSGLIVPNDAL